MANYNVPPFKEGVINLETSAYYQPYQELNINFYTMDINSAILKFIVTQNNEVLSIGEPNIKAHIVLKHRDGSKIVDNLDIYDGMNGILTYRIPNEFLARQGQVTAQVYVARKGKEVEGTSYAVVAERIFGFTISNSLIDSIDAETKLNYIIRFEELEKVIDNRIKEIEETFESVEQYVQRIEMAKVQGVSEIELAINQGVDKFNSNFTEKLSEVDEKKSEVIENIESKAASISQSYSTVQQAISDFESNKTSFVTEEDSKAWQKAKLTDDFGNAKIIENIDFNDPESLLFKSGFYYVDNSSNGPENESGEGFLFYLVQQGIKEIFFSPYGSSRRYSKNKFSDYEWSTWKNSEQELEKKINSIIDEAKISLKKYTNDRFTDTDWQPLVLMNGVKADSSAGGSYYRVKNGMCEIRFNLLLTEWRKQLPVFQVPLEYSPSSSFSFFARTTGSGGKNPLILSYDTNNRYFKIWENNSNSMSSSDYAYGQITYFVG